MCSSRGLWSPMLFKVQDYSHHPHTFLFPPDFFSFTSEDDVLLYCGWVQEVAQSIMLKEAPVLNVITVAGPKSEPDFQYLCSLYFGGKDLSSAHSAVRKNPVQLCTVESASFLWLFFDLALLTHQRAATQVQTWLGPWMFQCISSVLTDFRVKMFWIRFELQPLNAPVKGNYGWHCPCVFGRVAFIGEARSLNKETFRMHCPRNCYSVTG